MLAIGVLHAQMGWNLVRGTDKAKRIQDYCCFQIFTGM